MRNFNSSVIRSELLAKFNNTCQSCGVAGVPLQIAHINPASKGSLEIENLTVLCPSCHAILDAFQPREFEFNSFLGALLESHPDFSNISFERSLGGDRGERADLTATRKVGGRSQTVLIESKGRSFFRDRQIESAIAQIENYRRLQQFDVVALAFPGRLSVESRKKIENASIEVWDLDYVAQTFAKQIQKLPVSGYTCLYSIESNPQLAASPAEALMERLSNCVSGRVGWVEYQKIIRDIFELLFTPPLGQPIWESPDLLGVNRRDMILPNYASEGFWKFLRESYQADYIVVDPKNYKNRIKKSQVLQIANYLKPHGAGMFAIIVCRNGGDAGCNATLREQWAAHRKLIILLTNDDIKAMLLASSSDGKPEEVIGQIIQEFRLSM